MNLRSARAFVLAGLFGLLLLPAPARAQPDPDREVFGNAAKTFDVVVLRPLGLAAALVGVALFPATALLTAPGGTDTVLEAWETFVLAPGKNVFQRPLGSF